MIAADLCDQSSQAFILLGIISSPGFSEKEEKGYILFHDCDTEC